MRITLGPATFSCSVTILLWHYSRPIQLVLARIVLHVGKQPDTNVEKWSPAVFLPIEFHSKEQTLWTHIIVHVMVNIIEPYFWLKIQSTGWKGEGCLWKFWLLSGHMVKAPLGLFGSFCGTYLAKMGTKEGRNGMGGGGEACGGLASKDSLCSCLLNPSILSESSSKRSKINWRNLWEIHLLHQL